MTGGYYYDYDYDYDYDFDYALSTVANYSQSGLVEYLPSLNQRRAGHACSSFVSDSGETVGFVLQI